MGMGRPDRLPGRFASGRRSLALFGLVAGLAMLVVRAPGMVLAPIAEVLITDRPIRPADAAVLTPDLTKTGVQTAIILWRRGMVDRFLIANAAIDGPPGTDADEWADLARRALEVAGVPGDAAVVVAGRPCTPDGFVDAIHQAVRANGFRRLVFLAPYLATRRTEGEWSALLGPAGIEVEVVGYGSQHVVLDRWWQSRAGVSAVFNAYLGYVLQLVPMGPAPGCQKRTEASFVGRITRDGSASGGFSRLAGRAG